MLFPERRVFALDEIRVTPASDGDEGPRQIEWYAAVFDSVTDVGGMFRERLSRRVFSKTLADGADVRGLLNHDSNFVLGRNKSGTLSLKVDLVGLHATVTPPDTQWARDLIVSIERRDISGGSFGFQVIKDAWTTDADGVMLRTIHEAKLFDVAVVTYPAYEATEGSVALRSVFAGTGIDLDDLALPLLHARAGAPVTAEQRGKLSAAVLRLQSFFPDLTITALPADADPIPDVEPPITAALPMPGTGAEWEQGLDRHSAIMTGQGQRQRTLALLRTKGGL
jgi:hypothetical protein